MAGEGEDRRVASALFRARLVDEATLREAMGRCAPGALADSLVSSGRISRADMDRALAALGSSSGSWPAAAATVLQRTPSSSTNAAIAATKPGEDLPPGTRLGPYVLKKLLARGGMGAVFVASHEQLGRTVALKTLLAGEGASEEQVARFLVEAKAASKVAHANVVPVYDVGEAQGIRYLTMELVQGPSLKKLVKAGDLEPRRALALVEQVARGVAAAHATGIIHRDLKPDNVLVAPGDVAKVMDFGLAREADAEAALTASGAVMGTPQYMAPEQAAGEKVGPLADVYGLGAILYECLTGKPPYDGPTVANILTKIFNSDIVPPRRVRAALNKDVETICLKALEKDPARRYASAGEFADDMARWLKGDAIVARPPPPLERLLRSARRHKGAVVVGALGVVAVVLVVLWFTVRTRWECERDIRGYLDLVAREVASVSSNPDPDRFDEGAIARVESARRVLRDRWRSEIERHEELEKHSETALLYATAAGRCDHGDARKRFLALAYAIEPSTRPGLLALSNLIAAGEGSQAMSWVEQLLKYELPPEVVASLRLNRAKLELECLDIPRAAADLAAVARDARAETKDRQRAEDLLRIFAPLARQRDVAVPPGYVSVLSIPGEKRARIGVCGGSGEVTIGRVERGKLVVEHSAPAPRRADGKPVAEPEDLLQGSAATVRGDDVYAALWYAHGGKYRLVLAKNGVALGDPLPRNSFLATRGLRFVDLGDPGSVDLVCNVGPNDGDSVLARIDAVGVPKFVPLDRSFPPVNESTYITSFATNGPLLLLGYGAWHGYCVRGFHLEGAALARAPDVEMPGLGVVEALERAGESSLVALIGRHEDRSADKNKPARVIQLESSSGLTVKRSFDIPERPRREGAPAVELAAFRRKEGLFAVWSSGTLSAVRDMRLGFARFGDEPLADVLDRSGGAILGAGDLDGDGQDELVLAGPTGVRVLGLADGEPAVVPEPSPSLDVRTIVAGDLLRQLEGFSRQALRAIARREEDLGASTYETERLALRVVEDGATRNDPDFDDLSRLALKKPGASLAQRARIHGVRAAWLSESDGKAVTALAELDAARTLTPDMANEEVARLERVARVLSVRGDAVPDPWGGRTDNDFPLQRPPAHFVASDPLRFRFDSERGLVARVDRRVPLLAGIPVDVPLGTIRITVELRTGLPAWGAKVRVGLFREAGTGIAPEPLPLEGLVTSINLWHVASIENDSRCIGAGFGRPEWGSEPDQGLLRFPGASPLAPRFLSLEHAFVLHLRSTLEHDARTRWSRWKLEDLETGKTLREECGTSALEVPPGPYLLGVRCPGDDGADIAGGGNWQPDAEVALERVRLEHVPVVRDGRFAHVIRDGPAAQERTILGEIVARRKGARDLEPVLASAESAARARLLFQAAALVAATDAKGASALFAKAIGGDPVSFLRAVEDDAGDLDDAMAAALRHAIAAALRDASANDERLLERAVLHRLRGEIAECLACCDKLPASEARAYVRMSAQLRTDFMEELNSYGPRRALPEVVYPLRSFWEPLEPVPDIDASMKERYDPRDRSAGVWLDRWIELSPRRTDLLLERALRTRNPSLAWRVRRDLARLVTVQPRHADAVMNLGLVELRSWDFAPAIAHLRQARELGRDAQVREILGTVQEPPERLKKAIEEVLR